MVGSLLSRWTSVPALVACLLLAGCSGTDVLNAVQSGRGVETARGLAYGEGERRRLDVYAPADAEAAPVVVFFYGGSWDSGDREMYEFVGNALAERGFVTVIPDYRVYPEIRYPTFLRDSASAVRWARDHAAEFGGDPGRLVLMGHSAGAYNAAMLAFDPRWLGGTGLSPDDLDAFVGLAGPYDFLPLKDETVKEIFSTAEDMADTQPVNHVRRDPPPVFLGYATGDETVDPRNSKRLAEAVREAGGRVELRSYEGLSHALLVGTLGNPVSLLAPVREDVVAFIEAVTAK